MSIVTDTANVLGKITFFTMLYHELSFFVVLSLLLVFACYWNHRNFFNNVLKRDISLSFRLQFFSALSFTVSTPVHSAWQSLKRLSANLFSSVSFLLCSLAEKTLFIWPKLFAVPFALLGAYRPRDNSKSPSAGFLFIKSFLGLLFKSASICLTQ